MTSLDTDFLIKQLEQDGELEDNSVATAFRAVPRHLFLPGIPLETVYRDVPVYTRTDDEGGFIGGADQPSQVARLLTLADLKPGQNVLEIGTGTGYNAALIQHMVGDEGNVTSLEIDMMTAESARDRLLTARMGHVSVVNTDGAGGYSPRASYDRIISTVVVWDIPTNWMRQLRPDGLIVTPIYLDGLEVIVALKFDHDSGWLVSDHNMTGSFVPMQGLDAPPSQHLYMGGGSALRIYSNQAYKMDSASLHLLMLEDAERCHLGVTPSNDDYWNGFVPYMMLNVPPNYQFVCYAVEGDKIVYGLSGRGFGLISKGSASFVGDNDMGDTHCFAGVDAFLVIDSAYRDWVNLQKPRIHDLRVRMVPKSDNQSPYTAQRGRVFDRRHHYIHAWLDTGDTTQSDGYGDSNQSD